MCLSCFLRLEEKFESQVSSVEGKLPYQQWDHIRRNSIHVEWDIQFLVKPVRWKFTIWIQHHISSPCFFYSYSWHTWKTQSPASAILHAHIRTKIFCLMNSWTKTVSSQTFEKMKKKFFLLLFVCFLLAITPMQNGRDWRHRLEWAAACVSAPSG